MLKPTSEEVEEVLSEWKPVVAHFCQKLTKGDRHIFVDGVSIWSRESADETIKITPKMVLSLAVLRVALLAQEEELEKKDRRINRLHLINKDLESQLIDNGLRVPPRGSASKLTQLQADNQALKALSVDVSNSPGDMQEIMRKNNIVIDNHGDPMQKLAFTFYSRIVSLAKKARELIEEEPNHE